MDIFDTFLVQKPFAHRGLLSLDFPENTLASFENCVKNGFAIELDVQEIADGTIVVFHDETLSRMTGLDGFLRNLTIADLEKITLPKNQKIPTFDEALKLVNGQVPLLIEIKNHANIGGFEDKLLSRLSEYQGEFAIESFNPYILLYIRKKNPNILLGQLAGFFKGEKLSFFKKFAMKRMILNRKTRPDFIAYEAKTLPNRFVNQYKELPLLAWTVRSEEEYLHIVKHSDNVIF